MNAQDYILSGCFVLALLLLEAAGDVLETLGILPATQFAAIAMAAIFIYRYFTDRG